MELKFKPKTKHEEFELLLQNNEFSELKKYLSPLILGALKKFSFKKQKLDRIYNELINDVPIAVSRYLGNKKNIESDYKFSTYFTWYISERIKKNLSFWQKIMTIF